MRASAEGGDDVGNKPASRKRKRKPVVEVDLNDLPPEQANKLRIDMKIDEILRGSKKTNRPRKKKNNEESLDTFGDVEVARLREAMNNAADEDIRSNSEKLPATAKLKLLPEAMETLRKASLAQSMIDNNLLEAVRRWLEPLPDRSLPALNIQREFFGVIKKMEFIDSTVLKESGLGRVVLFYTKCKRVTPDISRTANELVSTWSRPIIKRSASYRDRVVPSASVGEHGEVDMRAGEKLNAILKRAAEAEKGKVRRSNAVMIPQRELGTYTVAPKMNAGIARGNTSVDIDTERRRKNAERMRTLTRRVAMCEVKCISILLDMIRLSRPRNRSALSPLAIAPPMPHRRSSLLSVNSAASPRTPRSCRSPSLYYPAHRKSTDSWNSSNADDMDVEWKQEHVLLLSRTLDALPVHLVTPFNGPVPPSNLLDKIARGVLEAKGPQDWPYSIRATRVKLLEVARARAKEETKAEHRRYHAIQEEIEIDDGSHYSYLHDGEDKPISGPGIGPRRPLYRQSSMDFIKPGPDDLKDNPNIARLSNRLQKTDRVFANPAYRPYSRIPRLQETNRRSSSPPHPADVPALISPSTPSTTTLNSFTSLSSGPRMLRRSASSVSSGSLFSTSSNGMLADPRIQRVRRSDSFCANTPPPLPPKDLPCSRVGLKRAPSYGALAQEVRKEAVATDTVHERKLSGSYPSSDEEERARTRHAKKLRTKTGIPQVAPASLNARVRSTASPPSSPTTPQPKAVNIALSKDGRKAGRHSHSERTTTKREGVDSTTKMDESSRKKPLPMNLQRNPSMFGAELPHLKSQDNEHNTRGLSRDNSNNASPRSPSPSQHGVPYSPCQSPPLSPPPLSPSTTRVRTLRRTRRLPPTAPGRRISFNSLKVPVTERQTSTSGDEADMEGDYEGVPSLLATPSAATRSKGLGTNLGSAFQLL
ncbi:hypothetical protein CPC08DRAFT_683949 [Agrocybe pediades]|nr:hypothetical protein CPC08DRAFT_683949 [Agrocybe pediades]